MMKQLNCLIIDDEPIAREGINEYCREIPFLKVIALCKNVFQANHCLETNRIDLIFLDINMPLTSGIDWLKNIEDSPSVIMTTAYEEYALQSYTYNVLDYLIKPISFNRFLRAVNKVNNYNSGGNEKGVLFLKSERQLIKVKIQDILFAESLQNYIKVVTQKEAIVTQISLKFFKDQLPEGQFIQTHKSFIVSKYKVDKIVDNFIFIDEHEIPISVRLKKTVLSFF